MIVNYTGVSGSRVSYLTARMLEENDKALVVVPSGRAAKRLADDLAFFAPEAEIVVMPESENIQVLYEARSREALSGRVKGMQALAGSGRRTCVIAPVSAAVRQTVSPERFRADIFSIQVGEETDPADLKERLVRAGYIASAVTESAGEFSSRGGVVDIFPPASEYPVRVEFFGDEVDSIRTFDPSTQRSIENAQSVTIGPAAEFMPSPEEKKKALVRIQREYDRRLAGVKKESLDPAFRDGRAEQIEEHRGRITDLFEQQASVQIYADLIEYFDIDKTRLWDHAGKAAVIVADPSRITDALPESCSDDDFASIYGCANVAVITPFPERIKGAPEIDRIVNIRSRQVAPFNGQIDLFASETAKLVSSGYSVTIAASTDERCERVREYLEIAEVGGSISYRTGILSAGFVMDDDKVCFMTENDIFPQSRRQPSARKSSRRTANAISFSDLKRGDYVVHEVHGIGRFEGIRPVTADGVTRDYLVIRYAGSDVLYIPTEQLDIIQKYIGNSGNAPALSRLSGGSWKKTRERARRAIMEIAEDLVKLYAERQAAGGYAFGPDTPWQAEFESDFPYEETEDQLRAAAEIKQDMQKPLPMDRLLCGDVGYGKTEVASRAIFKCISEGRQAAILAPTTLLVNQHCHNLRERFGNFPFEIQELSRFRTQAEQKKVCAGLEAGSIDLVIGTHRLLSDDVKFADLGLLVIDEEQRFGVRHKEKIKELKKNIDVLTLSATPIPRTLNMSLTGIKDISLISEPPGDRLPVNTYVTPYDEEIFRNAIERELSRGGQVFVVTGRITGINQIRDAVERLVPHARTAIGHGRMSEETLENTMLDFVEGRTDVLIATTIIENGIDIPNANTMIILNADRFGLAQLYQLRGRVGRSSRAAYAYLMYQPGKVLTDIARKRLTAIREFTEFGAGFRLAMRDLELRGAGNMLGEAQSGHIESIGYELYCKEIDRAVRQLKGEEVTDIRAEVTIDLPVRASIPASYISDETLRLQAYRKIAAINNREDAEDLIDEITDRYGDPPDEVLDLIKVSEIRAHAASTGIISISRRERNVMMSFAPEHRVNAYALVMARAELGEALTIMSGRSSGLSLRTGRKVDLDTVLGLMRILREAADQN